MKKIFFSVVLTLVTATMFTSCKKDYTCTCTTTVGSIGSTKAYDLPNQRIHDANEACERYESDANNGGIGTTNCHL